jgi:integrase
VKIKQPKVKELKYTKDGQTYRSWQVVWNDREGKRLRKQFTDRGEAALFASEEHTRLINQGTSHWSRSTVLTEPQLRDAESSFMRLGDKYSLNQCVDYFLKHFPSPDFKISIDEASLKYRIFSEGQVRDNTLNQYRNIIDRFSAFTNNCFVHEVTTATVERFLHTLRAGDKLSKASPKTWNDTRDYLNAFFKWCVSKPQQYIPELPTKDVKRFTIASKENIEILTVEQCGDLMRYVETFKEGKLVRFFAIALFAGVRPSGELKKLAESDSAIRLDTSVIRIAKGVSKVKSNRTVKIQPNLHKWLLAYPGEIFPKNFKTHAGEVREKFGLTRDVLRHTFCTMHVMAFGSFAETAIEAGNSEKIIRSNYLGLATKADAKCFWEITPESGNRKVVSFAGVAQGYRR